MTGIAWSQMQQFVLIFFISLYKNCTLVRIH